MKRKFEMIPEWSMTMFFGSKHYTFYRIRALKDIPAHNVKKGDLGGWVEHKRNLSQFGDCWIADEARVGDEAMVRADALVSHQASVLGKSYVQDDSRVLHRATVVNTRIDDSVRVEGESHVYDSNLREHLIVTEQARIENSHISAEDSLISGNALLKDVKMTLKSVKMFNKVIIMNSELGTPSRPIYDVMINGKSQLYNVTAKEGLLSVVITDSSYLKNVILSGNNSAITGAAHLSGTIDVELATIGELVSVNLDKRGLNLHSRHLSGDICITDENVNQFTARRSVLL